MTDAPAPSETGTISPYLPSDMPEALVPERRQRARKAWDDALRVPLELAGATRGMPEAWFLGPRAENLDLLKELIGEALDSHAAFRRGFHPEDPVHITEAMRQSPAFRDGVVRLRSEVASLLEKLRLSAPFTSMRYQGHMLWDQAMPAIVGLFAGMLYNQNNVAAEASPVTTRLEIEVGNDLCRLLGYPVPAPDKPLKPGKTIPWGHITSGGTVANIEALWAARNLKFAAVAIRQAIREVPELSPARGLEVPLWEGGRARLIDLDTWTLLNLDIDAVAALPGDIVALGLEPARLTRLLGGYTIQNVGMITFYRSFMRDVAEAPALLAPATSHYSWPKAATLLGLGQNAVAIQRVDRDARLDLEHVETTLIDMLRRRVPVLCAVAVIGSTEESAVDPLAGLLELRERCRRRGLNFAIHADAAWGGYFRAMLRKGGTEDAEVGVPTLAMSDYVQKQYGVLGKADSITVDPHKSGYVPYPAGALCYRNAAMRDAISLQAPVVFHSQAEPTVGIYGVEGSKPGSAAAAVWLAHRVIRPDSSGYGRILGQCMWTSKRLFCRLHTLDDPRFRVTLFNATPAERARRPDDELAAERAAIRRFVDVDNAGLEAMLLADPAAKTLFTSLGSDQVILAFSVNFRTADGRMNKELAKANALNERVFSHCSLIEPRADVSDLDLVLTSSRFEPAVYGHQFVDAFCRRLGVVPQAELGVDFLISTTMDPWTTETAAGDFLVTIEAALRHAIYRSLDELGFA
jgi:glutamate/tyrosine decarboxylase-like PLP-dependent enzyme